MGEASLRHKLFYGVLGGLISSRRYRQSLADFVNSLDLKDNSRILDVGCGIGTVSFALHRKLPYSSILAFDKFRSQIKRATRYQRIYCLDRIDFYVGDIDTFPQLVSLDKKIWAKAESYDYIFASGVLEHVDLDKTIAKFSKYLKEDGKFIDIGIKEALAGKLIKGPMDFKIHSEEDILRAYILAGLDSTEKITLEDKRLERFRIAITGKKSKVT
ncbi:MAG: class I SAM-dependent methyltransferase [Candidatus Nanoarchaeia archaeon]|nr:class I SAM-dependent methyltransferase [Candidatus Nanoarchaeia archaeon]